MHIHTAVDLRCKHTTGNICATFLEAEDKSEGEVYRSSRNASRPRRNSGGKRAPRRE